MAIATDGTLESSYSGVRVYLYIVLTSLILLHSFDILTTHAIMHLYVHQTVPNHVDTSWPLWLLLLLTHCLLGFGYGLFPRKLQESEWTETTYLYRALLIALSSWGVLGFLVCLSGPGKLMIDSLTYPYLFALDNLAALTILVSIFVWSRGKKLYLVSEYSLTAIVCFVGWGCLILSVAGANHWLLLACSAFVALGTLRLLGLVQMLGKKSLEELTKARANEPGSASDL